MIPKSVDDLIHRYTYRLTLKYIRNVRKLVLILIAASLCFLLTIKAFVISAVLLVGSILSFVYFTSVIKSGVLTVYNSVVINIIFFLYLVVFFDAGVLCVFRINSDAFSIITLTAIFLIELICLFAGFFYTLRRVEKGVIKKGSNAIVTTSFYAGSGIAGYCLAKGIAAGASADFKYLFFTISLAFGASMMMFVIGMVNLSIFYFINKYNISDRPICKE